uniref:Hist_deacetyl domain-containing protein n=1 Tax=Taenia asiatica TaxID=60517 RepID=A0A0R3W2I3_TAEAS
LLYHTDMLNHTDSLHENCPECPDRLKVTYQRCSEFGLPQPANDELLRLAHTQDYIDSVAATAGMSDEARFEYVKRFDSASFNKDTHTAARLAAGALTHAVDVVTRGDTRNAFCLVRPPGHHAMKDEPCGYCVFNNVEIAAKHALHQHEANRLIPNCRSLLITLLMLWLCLCIDLGRFYECQCYFTTHRNHLFHRILIVDWDIHHGQATQYAFYEDPRVLYFSIHRYDQGNYWPSLRESDYDFTGQGPSYGYNINVPLDGKDYSDVDYLTIFNVLLMPIAYEHTYDSASLAAGSLLSVVDDICGGEALHGVAVVRPPGHHAEYDRCMGFCFFNNVALAVRHAQESHGLKKIAVIDWDIHHGNGLQHIFERDPNVLCLSIHRFDDGRYFPNSPDADTGFCGTDEGVGKTVNIPWNGRPIRDGDYLAAFLHVVLPILYEFRPELIIIAAGFDAARGDHLGGVSISMECFGHLTHLLVAASTLNNPMEAEAERRRRGVILALEGGYNLTATAEALSHCVATLLSDTCLRLSSGLAPTDKGAATIRKVVEAQKNHWPYLFDYSPLACHLDQPTYTRLQATTTSSTAGATLNTQASTEGHTGTEATVAATTNVATGVSFDSTSSASLFSPYFSLSTTTTQAELSVPAAQEVVMAFEAPQPAPPPPANSDGTFRSGFGWVLCDFFPEFVC